MDGKELYDTIIEALQEKKARDIVSLDIEKLTTITHYFIICSGTSTTHIKTLADEVEDRLKKKDVRFFSKEGYSSARWILMDYGEVVVHVFHQDDREFYDLERLWQDGEKKFISN